MTLSGALTRRQHADVEFNFQMTGWRAFGQLRSRDEEISLVVVAALRAVDGKGQKQNWLRLPC